MRRHLSSFEVRSDRHQRSGVVLVLFAVLLFVILPLMALVIDLAYVQLTRRQMQTAVNTAALEGLRFRDDNVDGRQAAVEIVSNVFDDDFDSSNGDQLYFDAGPNFGYSGGIPVSNGTFQASATINVPGGSSYPVLAENLSNSANGDLVAGNWVYDQSDPAKDEHVEAADYLREDFAVVSEADSQAGNYDAFLVRMRRTEESFSDADAATTGTAVPFLFGRGIIDRQELMARRERGSIVRATAIAHAVPAMTVGPYSADVGQGAAPVWIEKSQWDLLVNDVATTLTIAGTELQDAGGSANIGEFVTRQVVTVGDSLNLGPVEAVSGERYVPIYQMLSSGNRYVIGFGLADFTIDPVAGGTITRREKQIGESNASAHWKADLGSIPTGDLNEFLSVRNSQEEPLLAPALVQSIE